jgi:hypothetical protein
VVIFKLWLFAFAVSAALALVSLLSGCSRLSRIGPF